MSKLQKSIRCSATTAKNHRCKRLVSAKGNMCYAHMSSNDNNNQSDDNVCNDPCSICLSDVLISEDAGLICNHPHHVNCLKQIFKLECPICKGPLKFKGKSRINIKDIEQRENQEKLRIEQEREEETIRFINHIIQHEMNDLDILWMFFQLIPIRQ